MGSNREIVDRGNRVFTPAFHFYHQLAIESGQGCRVVDREGKSYLDCASGLGALNIGHNHPRVMERVAQQLSRFVHTGGVFYNETTVAAAEMLASVAPPGLDRLFFSNSGAEAVEGAIKLARYVTGRQGIIAFGGAFHGRTLGALSLTASTSLYREHYHPLLPSVYHAPYPFCYRCPFGCNKAVKDSGCSKMVRSSHPQKVPGRRSSATPHKETFEDGGEMGVFQQPPRNCDLACFGYLQEMLKRYLSPGEVAAIVIEPILGEGGYAPAPAPFLAGLRRLCDEHGIMLVFDEVQSGMGRCGQWFAAQGYGVVPDILTVAKGVASGFPLSAVVARSDLMEQWPTWAHGTTFGGNPVSCAAAMATMEAIGDEGLLLRCRQLGATVLARLQALQQSSPLVGDVRGMGLMIGVELVETDGKPAGAACGQVLAEALRRGVIAINCGPERNVIRFIPPLTIGDAEMELALVILEQAITAASP